MEDVISQAINNIKNTAGNLFGTIGKDVGQFEQNAQAAFWNKSNPIANVALGLQKATPAFQQGGQQAFGLNNFLQNNQPIQNYIPQFQAPKFNNPVLQTASNIGTGIANLPVGVASSLVTPIVDLGIDTAQSIGAAARGTQATAYNQLKSPISRLEYNVAGVQRNPQQTLGNIAGTGAQLMNYAMPGGGEAIAKDAAEQIGKQTILQAAGKGALQAGAFMGVQGGLQGISQGRNAPDMGQQFIQGAQGAAEGVVVGAATGGLLGAGSNILSSIGKMFPKATPSEQQQVIQAYNRDVQTGRFKPQSPQNVASNLQNWVRQSVGKKPGEPVFHSDLQKALGNQGGGDPNAPVTNPLSAIVQKMKNKVPLSPEEQQIVKTTPLETLREVSQGAKPGEIKAYEQATGKPFNSQQGGGDINAPITNPFSSGKANSTDIKSALESGNINPDEASALGLKQLPTTKIKGANGENVEVPQLSNPAKERQFITSVKTSKETSPTVQSQVEGTYIPKSNQALQDASNQLVQGGLDKATNKVMNALSQKKGTLTDQNVSDAIAVAKAHDANGNFDQATQIYNNLATHLTEAGRQVQAASLLSNRTPEGLLYSAVKTLKKAGVETTPAVQGNLQSLVDGIKQTDPGTADRSIATQKLVQYVNQSVPRSFGGTLMGLWRTGLLTGPETIAKVTISHGITTPFEMAAQIPADLADRAMSLVTGKRSLTATTKGFGSGFAEGLGAAKTKLTTGVDVPNSGGFESDFGSTTHQTPYEQTVMNIHSSVPKPAYMARFKVSLNDQALTEATNQGLKGVEKDAFVKDFVANPPEPAVQVANNDAAVATNQEKTDLGKLASGLQNAKLGPVPIGKFLAPFTRIPSAIGVNGLWNYTPLGISKEVISAVTNGNFDQRVMAQAFGRSATGSTVVALGALLAAKGMMTLKAPADAKERALWTAQGKQPNSIKIGNNWISLNAFGPVGLAMGVGAGIQQSLQESQDGNIQKAIADGLASGGGMLLDQPYLKGISGVSQALNDPTRYGQSFFNNTVGSIIPAAVSQTARGSDTVQRVFPNDTIGRFQSEIPGLRGNLPAQHDLYGRTIPGSNPSGTIPGAVVGTVNPFYPSPSRSDPVTTELQRLYDTLGSSGAPSIGQPTANQTINGQKVKLTQAQLQNYVATRGPQIQQQLTQLIADPVYQSLSDEEKTNAINSVLTGINKQVRGTININSQAPSTGQQLAQQLATYQLINPQTGAVKQVTLGAPIQQPQYTGNQALDSKLASKYKSQVTAAIKDVVGVYQAGKITAQEANSRIQALQGQVSGGKTTSSGTGGGKAFNGAARLKTQIRSSLTRNHLNKRFSVKRAKAPKMAKFKVKQPKLAQIRLSTPQKFKIKA